ncbi:hypothetical protein GCM10023321_14430 [Pseudonocardia eucalypti]|uniref:Uncharacterized protein n=1 Tax=Pseudonocardia eucalypti TaxID=648755 RepID=A0ABP9PP61_9PSEU
MRCCLDHHTLRGAARGAWEGVAAWGVGGQFLGDDPVRSLCVAQRRAGYTRHLPAHGAAPDAPSPLLAAVGAPLAPGPGTMRTDVCPGPPGTWPSWRPAARSGDVHGAAESARGDTDPGCPRVRGGRVQDFAFDPAKFVPRAAEETPGWGGAAPG